MKPESRKVQHENALHEATAGQAVALTAERIQAGIRLKRAFALQSLFRFWARMCRVVD